MISILKIAKIDCSIVMKICLSIAVIVSVCCSTVMAEETVYTPMKYEVVKTKTMEWVKNQKTDSKVVESIEKQWASDTRSPDELLELVIQTFKKIDLDTKRFVERCVYQRNPFIPQGNALLEREEMGDFYRANMGLFYGCYLSRRKLYDDALVVFKKTDVKQVIDPSLYFFYLSICQQKLFLKKESLETLEILLENTEQVPESYLNVARLMKYEIGKIKEKSIGEISHKMGDSRRRLDLGHGGPKAQTIQKEIIALLDELIKKKEEQSKSSSASSGNGGKLSGNSKPAEESRIKGQVAPGNVDEKKLIKQGGWGGLPPKEEAKAKSMINRQFPAHYRQAVEKYFRKLATRKAETKKNED
jgi:hypothetical protein